MLIDSQHILIIYLIFFALSFLSELLLDLLNMKYVKEHASAVPDPFREVIELEQYQRSVEYTLVKSRVGLFQHIFSSLFVFFFILLGWFGVFEQLVSEWASGLHESVLYVIVVSIVFSLVSIPFSLYSTFVVEERFGFNKMTLRLWFVDFFKSTLVSLMITCPLLYGLFWFMSAAGELWWVYAFLFIAGMQFLLMYLFPVFIAPLFNKFEPLEEGALRARIFQLAKDVGFQTSGIFVMDGSRRSGHGNAYFTGFGKNKRIVLFDTLIESLSEDESVGVLAHEIGHEKLGHIKKMLVVSLAMMLLGFWILAVLMGYAPFYDAFGFRGISDHAALIIFSFASGPLTYFISPLFSVLSRKHEYEADAFAKDAVGSEESLISALITLSKENLSNLTPHPWYSFFHYSHPTLLERIQAMKALNQQAS